MILFRIIEQNIIILTNNNMNTDQIKIETSDGEIHQVSMEIIKKYPCITDMLECTENNDSPVPLSRFTSNDLNFLLEYTEKLITEEKTIGNKEKDKLTMKFNTSVANLPKGDIDRLITMADFLGYQRMVNRLCDGIVHSCKNLSPAQIREKYNLKNDLSKEEEDEIKEKFSYLLSTE